MSTRDLGALGERTARHLLRRRGYRVLGTNWRCRYGELDIVATSGDFLCFIEVKTQSHGSTVPALEEVTPAKQQRIARAAAEFLRQSGRADRLCRFDVVSVVVDDAGRTTAEIIQDAFPAPG
jgi:putative endonuclease